MNSFLLDFISFIAIVSGILVITSKNPVISVLFLVSVFVNVSGYLVLLGLGFIGLSYLIVYVGAIAILFLFVIMMLNLQLAELSAVGSEYTKSLPLGGILGALFLFEFVSILPANFKDAGSFDIFQITNYFYKFIVAIFNTINSLFQSETYDINSANIYITFDQISAVDSSFKSNMQIQTIGELLYTNQAIWLLIASLVLLLSIIGPIVLTHSKKLKN